MKKELIEKEKEKAQRKDFEKGFDRNKLERLLQKKRHAKSVFNMEEKKLIACAFKSRLNEIKEAIKKVEILYNKSKFENMRVYLDQYKKGLL